MVLAAAAVGVVALVLLVVVFVLRHRLGSASNLLVDAERRLVLADERAEKAEGESRAAEARRTTAEDRSTALEGDLATARDEIAAANSDRDAAIDKAKVAEEQAAEAREAGARLIEAAAFRADGGGLWFLEAVRIERSWRTTLGTPDVSLFDGARDPAQVALEAVVDIVREESGTSFEVAWSVHDPLPPSLALAVVRAGDELVSALAVTSDGGELEVASDPRGVRLALRVEPEPDLPADLLAVFDVLGWDVGGDHGSPRAVTVTIPFGV